MVLLVVKKRLCYILTRSNVLKLRPHSFFAYAESCRVLTNTKLNYVNVNGEFPARNTV